MTWNEVIEVLSEFLLIENWQKDEDDAYSFVVDEVLEIRIMCLDKENVIFQGRIGDPLPPNGNGAEERLKLLLQWNFSRVRDNNDVLSIDSVTRKIAIIRRLPLRLLKFQSLLDQLESFVKNVDFWLLAMESRSVASNLSPLLNNFHR